MPQQGAVILVESALDRIPSETAIRDVLYLERMDAERPWGKVKSSLGLEVLLRFPRGQRVRHGDLLYEETGYYLVAEVSYPPVVMIRMVPTEPTSSLSLALRLGHFIGNQHFPMRMATDNVIRVPVPDPGPLLQLLSRFSPEEIAIEIGPGDAEDPLPNPQAHGYATH